MSNDLWFRKSRMCSSYSIDSLQKRRKYETLKHTTSKINNFSKKQNFANVMKNPHPKLKGKLCDSVNKPSASNVPGSWDLTVNDELKNTPLIPALFRMCLSNWPGITYRSLRTMLSGSSNKKPELLYLCVDPIARGMGLGAKLVKETISYSASRNDEILSVRCDDNLIQFYTKLGFTSSPKQEGPQNFLTYSQALISPNRR